ncbi:MAG: metal-dependent transcriptional regulator [Thermoplasmata archaeon]
MNLNELGLTEREMDMLIITNKIYQEGWPARVTTISKEMNIKPPTVEEYIKSLIFKGYVEKNAGIIRLTERGKEIIKNVERNHRIIETFLYKLGMNLENAHKNAELMQYYVTEDFVNNLCNLLGHPEHCPHGKEIPKEENCCSKPQLMEIIFKVR